MVIEVFYYIIILKTVLNDRNIMIIIQRYTGWGVMKPCQHQMEPYKELSLRQRPSPQYSQHSLRGLKFVVSHTINNQPIH